MKKKSAGMMMLIIIVSVFGWVAIVGLVIKPPFWLGAVLTIIGGIAIGTVVAYLIRSWWFSTVRGLRLPDVARTDKKPKYDFGDVFAIGPYRHRYGRAGEDLKKGTIVEADLAGRIAPPPEPNTMEITKELIWGNLKAAKEVDRHGTNVLGWSNVNVKRGQCCWFQQTPMGAEFEQEDKGS